MITEPDKPEFMSTYYEHEVFAVGILVSMNPELLNNESFGVPWTHSTGCSRSHSSKLKASDEGQK